MNSFRGYNKDDILLEGDLDEILSHKLLQALKTCKPMNNIWRAHVRMADLIYSVAWTTGKAFSTKGERWLVLVL